MTASQPDREELVARLRPLTIGWPDDLLDPRRPSFFARKRPYGHVSWYAIAHSPRQARELREYLLAFIGTSYSNFVGQTADWDAADPVEAEFAEAFPHAFRLSVRPSEVSVVSKLFERLRQLLHERPTRERANPLPLGRLLRDFELLLRAGDWPAATTVLDHLRERGQLNFDQLAGLNVRLLAGQESWLEILAAPELPMLVTQRLPLKVSEAIAASVYHESLAKFSTETEAAQYFREHVAANFGLLFRQRSAWRHPDAQKAAAIADASIRAAASIAPPADSFAAAVEAHNANDAENAFRLLLPGPFTAEKLRLLVEVALDLGTRDAARAAVTAVRDNAPMREAAFSRRASKAVLAELEEIAGDDDSESPAPTDWIGWLTRAAVGAWPDAIKVAANGVGVWPTPDPAAFNSTLADQVASAFWAIRDALPSLLEWLLPNGEPDPRFGAAYRLLLEYFVLDDDLSPATAPAVAELAAATLRSKPVSNSAHNDYAEVVESLATAWERLKRPALLDWGLGLLDLAAEHAVYRHADVTRLAQDVVSEFARVPRLVTSGQRSLLKAICAELDAPTVADLLVAPVEPGVLTAEQEAVKLRKKLGKRHVVLLTLQDRIAASFRNLMRESYPDARVDVVQEFAGTKRLRDLSKGADVFIVNTFDAKHAATTYVPQHRSSDAPTLYPKGKNAARQLDALDDWLRSLE